MKMGQRSLNWFISWSTTTTTLHGGPQAENTAALAAAFTPAAVTATVATVAAATTATAATVTAAAATVTAAGAIVAVAAASDTAAAWTIPQTNDGTSN